MLRHRLRLGGLISGIVLVVALGSLSFVVHALLEQWLIGPAELSWPTTLIGLALSVTMLGGTAIVAGCRPGNLALRRRVLAMDEDALWLYPSALWWERPHRVPWSEVDGVVTTTVAPGESDPDGPRPILVPWDHLAFLPAAAQIMAASVQVRWLTATVEQIVEQARRRRPDLPFDDARSAPGPGALRRGAAPPPPPVALVSAPSRPVRGYRPASRPVRGYRPASRPVRGYWLVTRQICRVTSQ